jgi:hypothetical protein
LSAKKAHFLGGLGRVAKTVVCEIICGEFYLPSLWCFPSHGDFQYSTVGSLLVVIGVFLILSFFAYQ